MSILVGANAPRGGQCTRRDAQQSISILVQERLYMLLKDQIFMFKISSLTEKNVEGPFNVLCDWKS